MLMVKRDMETVAEYIYLFNIYICLFFCILFIYLIIYIGLANYIVVFFLGVQLKNKK